MVINLNELLAWNRSLRTKLGKRWDFMDSSKPGGKQISEDRVTL